MRASAVAALVFAASFGAACSNDAQSGATAQEAAAVTAQRSTAARPEVEEFERPPIEGVPPPVRQVPVLPSCPEEKARRPEWAGIAAKKAAAAHRPEPAASPTPPELPPPARPADPALIPLQQRYLAEWRARAAELDRLPPEQRERELAKLKRSIIGE